MKQFFTRPLMMPLCAAALVAIASCAYPSLNSLRWETAKRLAYPSFMQEHTIPAGEFNVLAFERVHEDHSPITIYIEGEGTTGFMPETQRAELRENPQTGTLDYVARDIKRDPTPMNPVALHLATRDLSRNVVWLAQPCQYTQTTGARDCAAALHSTHRFSPQIVEAMNLALTNIKRRYGATKFHLVGYSGGATIAVALAAMRDDIADIRTINGVLDNGVMTTYLNNIMAEKKTGLYRRKEDPRPIYMLGGSFNAVERAPYIARIPQVHFVGVWDEYPSQMMAESFISAQGASSCGRVSIVDKADRDAGWVEKWPDLLKEPFGC